MAGDWIKIENTTPDKPEIFRIADALDIDPDAAIGKLLRIWVWADQQTIAGNAASVTASLLDRVAGVTGFASAMLSVGWLVAVDDGFSFPNFDRHNGETAKTRALTRKRVQKMRNANVTQGPLPREEIEKSKRKGATAVAASSSAKGKRRKPRADAKTVSLPASLETDSFRAAWCAWCDDRAVRRKPITEAAATLQLKKLVAMGEAKAITAIENAIAGSWTGLFEPETVRPAKPSTDPNANLFDPEDAV